MHTEGEGVEWVHTEGEGVEWVHVGGRVWSGCVGVRDDALFPELFRLLEYDLRELAGQVATKSAMPVPTAALIRGSRLTTSEEPALHGTSYWLVSDQPVL